MQEMPLLSNNFAKKKKKKAKAKAKPTKATETN